MPDIYVTVEEIAYHVTVTPEDSVSVVVTPPAEYVADVTVEDVTTLYAQVLGVPGPPGPPGSGSVEPFTVEVDEQANGVSYVGRADEVEAGNTADPVWQIEKIVDVIGQDLVISYPNGDDGFTFIWDNRASYTYAE